MGEGPSALEQGECLVDIALDIEIACDVGPREAEFARRRRDSTKSVGERSTMPDRRKSRSKAARAMSEMKADEPRPEPRGRRGDSPAHPAPVARRRRAFGKPLGARSEPDDSLILTLSPHASWTVVQLARGNVWESDIPGLRQITST